MLFFMLNKMLIIKVNFDLFYLIPRFYSVNTVIPHKIGWWFNYPSWHFFIDLFTWPYLIFNKCQFVIRNSQNLINCPISNTIRSAYSISVLRFHIMITLKLLLIYLLLLKLIFYFFVGKSTPWFWTSILI